MDSFWQGKLVTNREVALRRLGGSETLLATLAGFFLEDAPVLMKELGDACRSNDLPIVCRRAHSLKGLSATFEAVPFQSLAGEIETMARAGDNSHLNERIRELEVEFDRLVMHLRPMTS